MACLRRISSELRNWSNLRDCPQRRKFLAAERQLTVAVGFSPRTAGRTEARRVAMLEPALGCGINRSGVAPRRRIVCLAAVRGLKPTAYHRCLAPRDGGKCPNS